MFSRFLWPYYRPPPRPWNYSSSRYPPNYSSFIPWRNNRCRYGNSRRSRRRRRRATRVRDREYYRRTESNDKPEEEEQPEPELPTEEILKHLHVEDVDFNIKVNTKKHHTDKYEKSEDRFDDNGKKETAELVVRRGQEFLITLNMDRPYDKERDDMRLVFRIGSNPLPNKGTEIVLVVNETGYSSVPDITSWRASIQSIKANDVEVSVYPAANCIIGEWDFAVQTVFKEEDGSVKVFEYDEPDNIYIILNPFCKDDTVYMETQGLLDEYILNDQGGLWFGAAKGPRARPWFYGQFEDGMLDVSFLLLRKGYGREITKDMSDPVAISRMLSKMVNTQDDEGVLVGNWSGDYTGGRRPTSWTGSVAILQEYLEKKRSVQFGQCWVFSGVLTTVCRAIGIPCRSITNFDSAHDKGSDATIDQYFHMVDGVPKKLRGISADSIWNFHVWNDVWFSRPDLPKGYDGWQALDATPQERSDGFFQCGPCPVAAIRKGQLWIPHDGIFIFGEVNGHVVHHLLLETGMVKVIKVDKKKVGKKMSTKVPNGKSLARKPLGAKDHPDRLDCTHLYKPPDGSRDEALVQETVARFVENAASFEGLSQDIAIFVDDIDTLMVGSDFDFKYTIQNMSRSAYTLDISVIVNMTKYTGVEMDQIKKMNFAGEQLRSGESKKMGMHITVADYLEKLHGEESIKIEVVATVRETGDTYVQDEEFTFDHPDVTITPKGPYAVDKPFDVLLEIQNPLSIPLTGLSVRLEGPGLRGNGKLIEPKQKTIAALGTLKETVTLTPKRPGKKTISASFDCEELPDITGQAEIEVPAPPTAATE